MSDTRPPRIVAVEANMARVDGDLERDLYAVDEHGRVWSLHFDPGSTSTGRWVQLPPLPAEP